MVGQRKGSKTQRVLMALKNHKYVMNWELNMICFRYSAIIHELRKEGHIILTERMDNNGLFRFTYQGEENE